MLINIMLILVPLLYLAARILWAVFFRKKAKTKFRFFGVLISFGLALVAAFLTKSFIGSDTFLIDAVSLPEEVLDLFMEAPALRQLLSGVVSSLVIPLLFLLYFMVFDLISWIVYIIAFSIGKKKKKAAAVADKSKINLLKTVAFALGNALIVIFVWMLPIGVYADLLPSAMACVTETEMVSEEEKAAYEEILAEYVTPINENPVVGACRFLGGSLTADAMTTFEVNGQLVGINKTVGDFSKFLGHFISLGNTSFAEYGDDQIALLDRVSESFADSKTLPIIFSEAVHYATDSWLEGGEFLGVSSDSVYIDERGIFNGFIDKTILILNQDTASDQTDQVCKDVDTTFEMIKVLIRHGVFSNATMNDNLLAQLAKDGTVRDLIEVLEQNSTMSALVPEITNIGMSAIGSTLGGNAADTEEYSEMMDSIATELNGVKQMAEEEQVAYVENLLVLEFEKKGLIVQDSVVENYANQMVEGLVRKDSDGEIDSNDMLIFFSEHSWEASQLEKEAKTQS